MSSSICLITVTRCICFCYALKAFWCFLRKWITSPGLCCCHMRFEVNFWLLFSLPTRLTQWGRDVKLGADEMMLRERVAASKICGRQTPTTSEAGCYTRLSLLHIASTFASSTASSSRPYRGQNRSSNAKLLRPSTEKAKKKTARTTSLFCSLGVSTVAV